MKEENLIQGNQLLSFLKGKDGYTLLSSVETELEFNVDENQELLNFLKDHKLIQFNNKDLKSIKILNSGINVIGNIGFRNFYLSIQISKTPNFEMKALQKKDLQNRIDTHQDLKQFWKSSKYRNIVQLVVLALSLLLNIYLGFFNTNN